LRRLHEDGPGSIGIVAAHEKATPGGTTSAVSPTDVHLAVLTQRGNGAGVPRRSVIMDRRLASACLRQRRAGFESVVSPVAQRLDRWQRPSYGPLPSALREQLRRRSQGAPLPARRPICGRCKPRRQRVHVHRSSNAPRIASGMRHRSRKTRCTGRVWRVLRVHFPPEPPSELPRDGLPVMSQHSVPKSLCRGLTGHPRRSMSLIEKSEIFRAKQSCENADIVTITTIFPTF